MDASESTGSKPFPGPLLALAMTYLAWWAQFAWTLVLRRWAPEQIALGAALLLGYGAIGYLALASVGAGWRTRVGWTAVDRRAVPGLVLLVPVVFVSLAVQAVAFAPFHRGGTIGIWEWHGPMLAAGSSAGFLAALLVLVLLMPVLAEWFFRGVVQQGVVARLGRPGGVLVTAALYGALVAGLRTTPTSWVAIFAGTLVAGLVLGAAREATGSLWAPAAVHAGASAVYALLHLLGASLPIGFVSVNGRFVAPGLAGGAAVSVGLGLVLLAWAARRRRLSA